MSKNKKKHEEKVEQIPVEAAEEAPAENEELKKLQEELAKKQQELDDTVRLLQRNQADFENFRRRNNSVRAESYENGKRDAVSELLPSLDDFDRIMANADKADEAWVEGVKLVYRKFTDELKKLGLVEIEAEGKFDPNLHNAVSMVDSEEYKSNQIANVFQTGYKIGDKIIRHAMVQVVN